MRGRTAPQGRIIEDLAAELSTLPRLPRDVLCERFRELYEITPASHLSRKLLVYAIAYRLQERMYGGLGAATRRQLARAAEEIRAGRAPSMPAARIKPGSRLLREWQGVVHEVIVLERGVAVSRQRLAFALGRRARDQGYTLVWSALLRAQEAGP